MPALSLTPDELLRLSGGTSFETGREVLVFDPNASEKTIMSALASVGPVVHAGDLSADAFDNGQLSGAGALFLDQLNIAIVTGDVPFVASAGLSVQTEPELFLFALEIDLTNTWGLEAVKAPASRYSGQGIKVAILDTGFDLGHPDFTGRPVVAHNFISGSTPQDVNGHGTHCTGTACGPKRPSRPPRYGVAHEADIYIGKVLSDSGSGSSAGVLAGMNWAVQNRCEVISMSLGGPGGPYQQYTQAGQAALNAGCLIVAAAGNDSSRPGHIAPTKSPANSPTIVSVAALDENLNVARFSCGGKVQVAAPGVNVYSSLPMPRRYGTLSGTSMAAPHVAGIAALWAQADPRHRGAALRQVLMARAKALPFPASDVGAGLVQAP